MFKKKVFHFFNKVVITVTLSWATLNPYLYFNIYYYIGNYYSSALYHNILRNFITTSISRYTWASQNQIWVYTVYCVLCTVVAHFKLSFYAFWQSF